MRVGTRVSAAHSRGPAGPVVHRSHSSRVSDREGLGSEDCGPSQSAGSVECEVDGEGVAESSSWLV